MKQHENTSPLSRGPTTGFLRLSEVLKLIPLSKTTFWEYVRQGKFPKPIKLGVRASAWRIEDVQALIDVLSNPKQGETNPWEN